MKSLILALACAFFVSGTLLADDAAAGQGKEMTKIHVIKDGPLPTVNASADNFTGDVTVARLFPPQDALGLSGGYVTFSPGARTNWHTHPEGQLLIITAGKGRVQQEGEPVIEVKEGDVVFFPPNVKHWHGAAPDQSMTHIAMAKIIEGKAATWLEKVDDAQYNSR